MRMLTEGDKGYILDCMKKGINITQCDRILGYLMDYEWHSSLEFVRMARPILSYTRRIHELRKHHKIEGKEVGNIHYYRLVQQ